MATKTNPGNFFEDFKTGSTLVHAVPRTITEGDCAVYIGLTGDRYLLHCSAEFARSLGYKRETVNDLLLFHMVFGKTVNDISLNAVANLGYADVRFLRPAYPGDTVNSVSEVLGKKENSDGKTGVVWVRTTGSNQRGEEVLRYCRWAMVRKKNPDKSTGDKDAPSMPRMVEPKDLVVHKELNLGAFTQQSTGGRALWEDYEKGEIIDHIDGMTIEEAEHATATRLYQNTAKVHFDGLAAQATRSGKRLMYGGHVISVARALSFNGLENALGILAWNSGTHVSPSFSGDTVFAFSEVLDKAELSGRKDCGALRVRLVALKNISALPKDFALNVSVDGKEKYHESVVLDLDYWLLLPRAS